LLGDDYAKVIQYSSEQALRDSFRDSVEEAERSKAIPAG
jgi:hypothetical protein